MNAHDFRAWRRRENLTISKAAEVLGIGRTSVMNYEADGAPPYVAKLITALEEVKRLNALFYPGACDGTGRDPSPPVIEDDAPGRNPK